MRRPLAALILACALVPTRAAGGEPTAADVQRARDLFAQASKAEAGEDFRSALETLKQVAAIKRTPVVLYHMANCEEHLGKLGDALTHFLEADALATELKSAEVKSLAPAKITAMRERAPRVTIDVTPSLDNTEVLLDGVPVPPDKLKDLRVNPDQGYTLVVRAPGRQAVEKNVVLKERDTADLKIELQEVGATQPGPSTSTYRSAPTPDDRHGRTRSILPLVIGGAAAAAFLGVGIGMTFASNGKGSDSAVLQQRILQMSGLKEEDKPCFDPAETADDHGLTGPTKTQYVQSCDELHSSETSRLTLKGFAIGAYIGAGAALAGGAVWYFMQGRSPSSGATSLRVMPILTSSTSGAALEGRF